MPGLGWPDKRSFTAAARLRLTQRNLALGELSVTLHSPLPPAPTGVADYSAALINALERPIENRPRAASVAHVDLYQIGNNQLHRDIYSRALDKPGVVVLHDAVLHHFFLGSLTEQQYIDEFVYNYGAWYAGLAKRLWDERAGSASDTRYFEYPMLRRIAERSLAIIVHNPAAASMVRKHAPDAPIHEIPHLFAAPELPPLYEIERLRRKQFVFGVFGHLRESKRLTTILRAFETVRASKDIALVVSGQFASSDLERSLTPLLNRPEIVRTGYLSDRDFWLHASAVDACINLRYPPAGETSGIAIRLMGIGKPVLLSEGQEVARYPESACIKIETGPREQAMLEAAMMWLAQSPADAAAIGQRARDYILRHHSPDQVAARYRQVLVTLIS